MQSKDKFKIASLSFKLKEKSSFEDGLSQYYQTMDNAGVILERITMESKEEMFYLTHEYTQAVKSEVFRRANIIRYYDFQYDDVKSELLVLREFSRKTLDSLLQTRRASKKFFSKKEVLDITQQILSVLVHLEENGFSLLNLKPTNIFTNDEVLFKVGGLARSDNHIWLNQDYIAPELKADFENNPQTLPMYLNQNYSKKKAAVFTLGLLLLEVTTLQNNSGLNKPGTNLTSNKQLKELLLEVEERYDGYRLFLERFFLPYASRPDLLECWCMSTDLYFIDDLILIGDKWDFNRAIENSSNSKEEETAIKKPEASKELQPTLKKYEYIKTRCGGGFYYKKVLVVSGK